MSGSSLAFLICAATFSLQAQRPGSIEIRRGGKVVASNADASQSDLRVLFIGNSLTFWNEMPWMFEQMARSLGSRPRAQFSGRSGLSLREHWREGRAQKTIAEGRWDYVVIQPQSTEMMREGEETEKYAVMFDGLVRKSGWARAWHRSALRGPSWRAPGSRWKRVGRIQPWPARISRHACCTRCFTERARPVRCIPST